MSDITNTLTNTLFTTATNITSNTSASTITWVHVHIETLSTHTYFYSFDLAHQAIHH